MKSEYSALLNTYNRFPVEFVKGEGAYLYDANGKEYIDFLSGIAVTGFGHNHPDIKAAVQEQFDKYWHVSNLFEIPGQEEVAQKLCDRSGLAHVFFSNSGTEAVEAAIKFARKWGNGKYKIISAVNGFHGRSYGSLSATGQQKLHEGFEPMLPGFTYVEFGNIEKIKEAYDDETVAIIVESIQGEGGVNVAPRGFLKSLRDFCDEKNILLIIDEIQTGIGRTGKFYSFLYEDIVPDIATSAKGLANGLPLGATLCNKKVASAIKPGNHGSTFGGNPVAIAAANKVLDLIDDNVLSRIQEMGTLIMNSVHALHLPEIIDVRGKGLMIGIQLKKGISCKKIASSLLDEGIIVGTSGDSVLRLLPPFIISQKEIMKFLLNFKKVIVNLSEVI